MNQNQTKSLLKISLLFWVVAIIGFSKIALANKKTDYPKFFIGKSISDSLQKSTNDSVTNTINDSLQISMIDSLQVSIIDSLQRLFFDTTKKPLVDMQQQEKPEPTISPVIEFNRSDYSEDKWTMLGLNRAHFQDFGATTQLDSCIGCGSKRQLLSRSNISLGIGFYKNFSKKMAFSADVSISYGYVAKKTPDQPTDVVQAWFPSLHTDLYYHLSDGRFQPYVFAGLHGSSRSGSSAISAPVGFGGRYMIFNDHAMLTAQVGYGLGLTNTVSNNVIASWGVYINMSKNKSKSLVETPDKIQSANSINDTDGDGIVNEKDKCPTVAGLMSNEGCPVSLCFSCVGNKLNDRDYDGIADDKDKCPDISGPVTNQGCPIDDKDGDGVVDAKDKCPYEYGPPSNDGCPISDRDGDGIIDNKDRCPDVFGSVLNEGCPTGNISGSMSQSLAPDRIIPGKNGNDTTVYVVYFNFNQYDLDISFNVVNRLKDYLKANTEYKCQLIGHTDLEGDTEYNLKLSAKRVEIVRNYFMSYYIDKSRISTGFFGKQQPAIKTVDKNIGWRNRRVEVRLFK